MKDLSRIINSKNIFIWIAIGTGLLLLIPLIGMQLSNDWNWTLSGFIVAGILIYVASSLFVIAARRYPSRSVLIGSVILVLFIYIWAELTVGIFTDLGS